MMDTKSLVSKVNSGKKTFDNLLRNLPNLMWQRNIQNYKPNVTFAIERPSYLIKTAETGKELEEILKLRHSVFYEELLHKRKFSHVDIDAFDRIFDHLMILDKRTNKIVGTYRVNSSLFNERTYSETEFDIKKIQDLPGRKLELGRACIHREHRNSVVLSLLWKGLWKYVSLTFTRYLFGCSSIMTMNHQTAAAIYLHLKEGYDAGEEVRVYPKEKFRIRDFKGQFEYAKALVDYSGFDVQEFIPPLLSLYLKYGARVCGEPALDRKMKCIDFFTLIDLNHLDHRAEGIFER